MKTRSGSKDHIPALSVKEKRRDAYLRRVYGITLDEYNALLIRQRNKCYICQRDALVFKSSLAVDHSHTTGIVRGLLCPWCNRGLRYFRDDPVLLSRAAKHVKRDHGYRVPDKYLKGIKKRRKRKKK